MWMLPLRTAPLDCWSSEGRHCGYFVHYLSLQSLATCLERGWIWEFRFSDPTICLSFGEDKIKPLHDAIWTSNMYEDKQLNFYRVLFGKYTGKHQTMFNAKLWNRLSGRRGIPFPCSELKMTSLGKIPAQLTYPIASKNWKKNLKVADLSQFFRFLENIFAIPPAWKWRGRVRVMTSRSLPTLVELV